MQTSGEQHLFASTLLNAKNSPGTRQPAAERVPRRCVSQYLAPVANRLQHASEQAVSETDLMHKNSEHVQPNQD